ncbi:Zinc carboxypeptidase [Botrimarina colliarenosi]|uniref:Zinc carboxypeptidase n=1 Tax=Botrimarina colliarenosi TaxID=2528001 RepID=A0A5C6A0V4_9BACT|nr:M14 family zinc carboxypeptidase [Botrimarina colliarenosi]TWT93462.1 Zinc carboxypeptidase [Botrimarina colliarenosi]
MLAWDDLIARSVITSPQGGWKPKAVAAAVEAVLAAGDLPVERRPLGTSFEGRPIEMLVLGDGPKRAMMWSQMHGDEPTHTAMLLNLLRLLVESDTPAERLLRGLTIGMILPLNPDGAERNTRQNAQGIDINRDALKFATLEGRAFRDAIHAFRPDYGFNLHNQGRRTALAEPLGPASVSLLAPPLDPEDTQTDSVREANRVAATFCERVRDACGGRVSRYDADFMPRAFGEWVQRQGVSVILVEAGGWPGGDWKRMEEVHFAAFVQTLDAIAATALGEPGGLEACDPQSYLTLPRSSPNAQFDLLIRGAGVAQLGGDGAVVATAELGVDFPGRMVGGAIAGGTVAAIGDLHENGGLTTINSPGVVLPGRIVLAEPSDDAFDESPADWEVLSANGATTVLLPINLGAGQVEAQIAHARRVPPPLNVALVATWTGAEEADKGLVLRRLTQGLAGGVVATLGPLPEKLVEACYRLGLPALDPATTPTRGGGLPASLTDWLTETGRVADQLGWSNRGRIGLGSPADFVLVVPSADHAIAQDCLRGVYVGGTVVRDAEGLKHDSPGEWIPWSGPKG